MIFFNSSVALERSGEILVSAWQEDENFEVLKQLQVQFIKAESR